MAVEKGMVTYYDGEYGEIKNDKEKYIFLKQDMLSELNTGELVSFKGEEVQGIKRAYFVNSLDKTQLPDIEKNKQK